MTRRLVLGMGTGRCGTRSLAQVLSAQPECRVTHEEWPLLPWVSDDPGALLRRRIERMLRTRAEPVVGDVASFYLPYVGEAIRIWPDLRVICLRRPREEVVRSFCAWLDRVHPLPTNHWAKVPAPGWHHEPVYTRMFPQYEEQDREAGIRRYWEEYYAAGEDLEREFPQQMRIFDTDAALNSSDGQRDLLAFAGVPGDRQVLVLETHENETRTAPVRRRPSGGNSGDPRDPRKCVVLVPYTTHIVPACETALKELERRGYPVRRVGGYAAIDQARNQMATDALVEGFEETFWIDSDVGFHPDSVEKLRGHNLPVSCAIYPQKGKRSLACHVMPGTPRLVFGEGGGLCEVRYAATGFLHVRREVYMALLEQLSLPVCNERFARPMIPFFQPLVCAEDEGQWYLAEDYSFCHRVRECGYRILADTTVRLWHFGNYGYSWEDAGIDRQRFATFHFQLSDGEAPRRE